MASIVDVGRGLERYGLRIGQHSNWGAVGTHAPNSYHKHDEAIDVTDHRADNGPEYEGGQSYSWQERTRRLKDRARQLGGFTEVLGPGDEGHGTHLHLALRGTLKDWNDQKLEWLATGRYRKADGSYGLELPGATGTGTLATGDTPTTTTTVTETPVDWRADASAADRSTDPSSQSYWQRQDMRLWAQANPELAKRAMANAGADAAWLSAPKTTTTTTTTPAAQTPAAQTPTTQTPGAQTPTAQTPAAPKPEDRGALNGTRVGGAPPRRLQPYAFEIHADADAAAGGKTGLIGSYLDADNPLFQQLNREYGSYGENNSRQWRGGNLGAPRHGLSIIETRTAGSGMADPEQHRAAAQRLYGTLLKDPDVAAGIRPVQFFAGHADTTNPGQQGAAGGDAAEKVWNTGVMTQLRQLAQKDRRSNFQFVDSIVDNNDAGSNTNWARAKALREQWLRQQANGGGT